MKEAVKLADRLLEKIQPELAVQGELVLLLAQKVTKLDVRTGLGKGDKPYTIAEARLGRNKLIVFEGEDAYNSVTRLHEGDLVTVAADAKQEDPWTPETGGDTVMFYRLINPRVIGIQENPDAAVDESLAARTAATPRTVEKKAQNPAAGGGGVDLSALGAAGKDEPAV